MYAASYLGPRSFSPPPGSACTSTDAWLDVTPSADAAACGTQFVVETENLTKEFSGFLAVKNVSLRIAARSVHALIGPNGAGKTTCFNLMTKFIEPTSGIIRYKGKDITRAKPALVARLGMVRSFQISATFPHLTVLENVRLALQRFAGTPYCFWRNEHKLDALNERALQLLADVGLQQYVQAEAAELPYGRKRALEIATTIALDPEVLLLDEPTAGMSHEDVAPIAALIKRISANRTVVMVEHNLSVVAHLSDQITVLARGEILAEGSYAEISKNADVIDAYLGTGNAC
jgi:branched-chain amino acid transport system ATP-binding protein